MPTAYRHLSTSFPHAIFSINGSSRRLTISPRAFAFLLVIVCAAGSAALFLTTRSENIASEDTRTAAPGLMDAVAKLPAVGFTPPSPMWELSLPADHGVHLESRTEAWQLATHLRTDSGENIGFQLAFLRLGITPADAQTARTDWQPHDVFRAHTIFQDESETGTFAEERFARSMPALVGFDETMQQLRLDDWVIDMRADRLSVSATINGLVAVDLTLTPQKPPLTFQPNGAETPFVGYAFTRLNVDGTLKREGREDSVTGTAWFDHTWGDLPLPGSGPVATDRVQFQLSDGTEGLLLRSRRRDGRGTASITGAFIGAEGGTLAFDDSTVQMTPIRFWQRSASDPEYPVSWRIEGPDFSFTLTPRTEAQDHGFSFPMWNGDVRVEGTRHDDQLTGVGTLQLTGYALP